ncbi:class I tRNA ligase family protein, partial [Patescibacteria group bacterium]|nr:class I tRNA ligase family protein [Patescibacteria group bacterium]
MLDKNKENKINTNSFSVMEEEVLNFWGKCEIFKKSTEKEAPRGDYVFYDGPPFATGEPHYGHLLSSISKDVIPRFWTMQGYKVERKWGWDCHGLPIENIVEQNLKISGKKEIEKMGIDKFCETCRSLVLKYADIWETMIKRIGRWVEFKNSYKTMDVKYMESVWWGFKKIWGKGLIYQGRKTQLYCPRCETPISNFEVAMDNSYKNITETSIYVKFKLKKHPKLEIKSNVFIMAWTTTPWTLPGNAALAVGENIKYAVIKTQNSKLKTEYLILAKNRVNEVFKNKQYEIVKELKSENLIGLEYEPLFDVPKLENSDKKNIYKIFIADFVTIEDGAGVVHIAPAYGEDDYNLGLKYDLPIISVLDEKGYFNDKSPQFKGVYFKKANKIIIENLDKRDLIFATEQTIHSYPFCHRCDTQLFYNAIPAWFIAVNKIKKRMIELNEKINWFPKHLKHGRFALGIEQAPDWNISRNRYFGTPIPIWKCDKCGNLKVIGAADDIKKHCVKSNNKYFLMRHGEGEQNVLHIITTLETSVKYNLTENGKKQIKKTAQELKNKKIDLIFSSDFYRTKKTAMIVAKEIDFDKEKIIFDSRLREISIPTFSGKSSANYYDVYPSLLERFYKNPPNGENLNDVKKRVGEFLYEIEK